MKARRTSAVRRQSLRNLLQTSLNEAANLESHPDSRKVHTVRKEMKRARSVLRLMRRAVGDRAYRSANARVRDAARPLTPVRDAEVLLHTLDSICRDDRQLRDASASLRSGLEADLRRRRGRLTKESVLKSGASLRLAARRLQGRPDQVPDTRTARWGMKRIYRAGRKAMDRARGRADEDLHEWRKQAKYLSNQAEVVRKSFGVDLKKIRQRARKLASLLGEDHDLALLHARIGEPRGGDKSARMLVALRIKLRRRALQKRARKIGKRLYRRPTRDFGSTLSLGEQ